MSVKISFWEVAQGSRDKLGSDQETGQIVLQKYILIVNKSLNEYVIIPYPYLIRQLFMKTNKDLYCFYKDQLFLFNNKHW